MASAGASCCSRACTESGRPSTYSIANHGRSPPSVCLLGDGAGTVLQALEIRTSNVWDKSSRLELQVDDNGNATEYRYDSLDRKTSNHFADNNSATSMHDAHGNQICTTDANGTHVTCSYDKLDRLASKEIIVGPGVSDDTTFELYGYDGLSRLVEATDNVASGGIVAFDIDAGFANAGRAYELVGSTLEPLAGVTRGSEHFPLRPDSYTSAIRGGKADAFLRNFRGNLDVYGRARAELRIPPRFNLLRPGTKLHHAFLVGDRSNGVTSEPVETLLIP